MERKQLDIERECFAFKDENIPKRHPPKSIHQFYSKIFSMRERKMSTSTLLFLFFDSFNFLKWFKRLLLSRTFSLFLCLCLPVSFSSSFLSLYLPLPTLIPWVGYQGRTQKKQHRTDRSQINFHHFDHAGYRPGDATKSAQGNRAFFLSQKIVREVIDLLGRYLGAPTCDKTKAVKDQEAILAQLTRRARELMICLKNLNLRPRTHGTRYRRSSKRRR